MRNARPGIFPVTTPSRMPTVNLILAIPCMEMGRRMVGEVHEYDNSVKRAYLWHDIYFLQKYTFSITPPPFTRKNKSPANPKQIGGRSAHCLSGGPSASLFPARVGRLLSAGVAPRFTPAYRPFIPTGFPRAPALRLEDATPINRRLRPTAAPRQANKP